jgi:hypothetical protein
MRTRHSVTSLFIVNLVSGPKCYRSWTNCWGEEFRCLIKVCQGTIEGAEQAATPIKTNYNITAISWVIGLSVCFVHDAVSHVWNGGVAPGILTLKIDGGDRLTDDNCQQSALWLLCFSVKELWHSGSFWGALFIAAADGMECVCPCTPSWVYPHSHCTPSRQM